MYLCMFCVCTWVCVSFCSMSPCRLDTEESLLFYFLEILKQLLQVSRKSEWTMFSICVLMAFLCCVNFCIVQLFCDTQIIIIIICNYQKQQSSCSLYLCKDDDTGSIHSVGEYRDYKNSPWHISSRFTCKPNTNIYPTLSIRVPCQCWAS